MNNRKYLMPCRECYGFHTTEMAEQFAFYEVCKACQGTGSAIATPEEVEGYLRQKGEANDQTNLDD